MRERSVSMVAKAQDVQRSVSRVAGQRIERRLQILRIAGELFLAHGFAKVSMDVIIKAAGGSKRDLYALFGDKDNLFKEVVEHMCRERILLLQRIPSDAGLVEALRMCAAAVLEIVLAPKTLALHRLFVAEADRLGDSASVFLAHGPHRARDVLAAVIDRHVQTGSLQASDPKAAATLFIGGAIGDLQLRALLGERIARKEISENIEFSVEMFLNSSRKHHGPT